MIFMTSQTIKNAQKLIKENMSNPNIDLYQEQEYLYWEHIPKWIKEYINKNKQCNILDIGCAYGTIAVYCRLLSKDTHITATDIFTYTNINFLNSMKIDFINHNIETDNILEKKYDLIILSEVIEHFNYNPLTTLEKIKLMLNDNGILIVTTPDSKYWGKQTKYYANFDEIPEQNSSAKTNLIDDHIWQYSEDEIISIFKQSGFKILEFKHSSGVGGRKHFNIKLSKEF